MKNVLVIGAFGGMGKATVDALLDRGVRVFALDQKVGEPKENLIPIEVDITREECVVKAFEKVREYTDSLCAIVHFA